MCRQLIGGARNWSNWSDARILVGEAPRCSTGLGRARRDTGAEDGEGGSDEGGGVCVDPAAWITET